MARQPSADETAARWLERNVPRLSPAATVGEAFAALANQAYGAVDLICLVEAQGELIGVLPLTALTGVPAATRLRDLLPPTSAQVHFHEDQERVASVALHTEMPAVPVVDHAHRLLGVVPAQALLHVLRREHVEDLHRLAGIRRETARARHALEAPPARSTRDRLPWLIVGLFGSVLATYVMARFEAALEARVAIAFFIPGLVYLADAIGTQTEAIAVRGLSLSHAPLTKLLAGELRTGFAIGASLGSLAFLLVRLAFDDARLATVVGISLLVASLAASSIGLLLPWTLGRLGRDPAYGSGPLGTIIQDILTLLVYFAIANWVFSTAG